MLVNTQYFRESALYYEAHGYYPFQPEIDSFIRKHSTKDVTRYPQLDDLSGEAQEYYLRENYRLTNGMKEGGQWITPEHYGYLNYAWITRTTGTYGQIHKTKAVNSRKVGKRDGGFPDFWDEDYRYYITCDIAMYGMSLEYYDFIENNIMTLGLLRTEDNICVGGQHHLWGKPRGVGASWKAGWSCLQNCHTKHDMNNFLIADRDEFLTKDGIFEKYVKLKAHIQEHSYVLRRSYKKLDESGMHLSLGTDVVLDGVEVKEGMNSAVIGVILNGDVDKSRGKRGNAYFEEFGSFPNVDTAWNIYRNSVEEYGTTYAQMRGFGTGGDKKGRYEALEKMMYDPKAYNIIQFNNVYEEMFEGTTCAMFTPAYVNISHKDADGNTDIVLAKSKLDVERDNAKAAKDASVLNSITAEKPYSPSEMFNNSVESIFPREQIKQRKQYLYATGDHKRVNKVGYVTTNGKFVEDITKIAYENYPVKASDDKEGAVVVIERPFSFKGQVPNFLYRISCDLYRVTGDSTSASIGSVFVVEQPNKYTPYKGDKIVATYHARPSGHNGDDKFYDQVFGLAKMYNAKIAIEADEPGGIVGHARLRNCYHYLEEGFSLGFDTALRHKTGTPKFGVNMGSGKDPIRKQTGDLYIAQWLLRPRGIDAKGRKLTNLDFIYDLGFLEELIKYRPGGNFDRISSFRVAMYHEKEFAYKQLSPDTGLINDPFFTNFNF